MRGFIAALLIFGLLICGIILNCTYITNTCETLQEKISALPPAKEARAATDALCAYWQAEQHKIGISVSLSTLDKLDTIFAELDYAATFGNEAAFEKCRVLALQAVKEIKSNEGFVPHNWI